LVGRAEAQGIRRGTSARHCQAAALYSGERRSISEAVFFGAATLKLLFKRFDVIDVDHMPFFPLFSARLVCWLRGKTLHATCTR